MAKTAEGTELARGALNRRYFVGAALALALTSIGAATEARAQRRTQQSAEPVLPPGYKVKTAWGARGYVVEGPGNRLFYYSKVSRQLSYLDRNYALGPQIDRLEQPSRIRP